MWICPRCNAENREANTACENCGSPRSAGRFGSAPPRRQMTARSPRVSSAPPRTMTESREQEFTPSAVRNEYAMPDMDARAKPIRNPAAALAKGVGITLCVLLPLIVGLLAWRQYDALYAMFTGLFQIGDLPGWMLLAGYILFALAAGLVALLPGLWTVLWARISRDRRW